MHLLTYSVTAENNDKPIYDNPLVDSMRSIQYSDHVKALKIGFNILEYGNLDKANNTVAQTYTTIGNIFFDQGFYGMSEEYYAKALTDYIELKDTFAVAWLYVSMGNLNFKNKLFDDAEKNYNRAMGLFIQMNVLRSEATVQNNLALIKFQQNDLQGALLSYKKALKLRRLIGDSGLIAHSYIYIGELYFKQKKLEKSYYYLHRAFEIGLKVHVLNLVGRSAQLLGDYYTYIGDSLSADTYFDFAEKDFREFFNASYLIDLFQKRAEISMAAGNYKEAKKYLLKALEISDKNNMIINKSHIYEQLLQLSEDKILVSDTAIEYWQSELNTVYKKLYNTEVGRNLRLIEMREELINFKVITNIQQLEVKKANVIRNTSIVIGLLALLLLFVIYLRYRDKRIKNAIIAEQKEEYFAQHMYVEQVKTERVSLKLAAEHRELVMKATFIQQKNELITSFKKELKYQISLLNDDDGKVKGLRSLLTTMSKTMKAEDILQDFESHFIDVYPEFLEGLSKKYPNLSAKDLKMCAYHKMNLDTKEIARIAGVTVRSVQTSRYRLRIKLSIPKDVSLIAFFNA